MNRPRRPFASEHAIDRFHQRFCPGFARSHAKRELILLVEHARPTREGAPGGAEVWISDLDARVKLIVARSTRFPKPTVLTVVTRESHLDEIDADELVAS